PSPPRRSLSSARGKCARGARDHRGKEWSMGTSIEASANPASGNGESAALGTAISEQARPQPAAAARYQRLANEDRGTGGESLADFLGAVSIGLGLAQGLAHASMSQS